ncbi:uncharacterized protein MONBRDRAFT_29524 [Monosiga brevicollis MX1]|uniref:Aspartyl/asparaginy/proline hydroxylase domain-containing protein n=1 Tax=Monosiga brevicollis TaxID=81824 RepID=A9VBC2_MONBE|nr:uncharacterized protein MONBRDRAFT_29524 [Monosiga brevicollis MX1]EDQ85211.1 predicted protein [Monosiga brevicollis MX1]|eukprot:XP_001750036.1 hypothetical protein [Monosiga brevicollis MX1]
MIKVHERNQKLRRIFKYGCLIFGIAALAVGTWLVSFTRNCIATNECGMLQEVRGFIALASVRAGHQPGPQPATSECGCHDDGCGIPHPVQTPITPADEDAMRTPGELNPPFVSSDRHFPYAKVLEDPNNFRHIQCETQCVMRMASDIPTFENLDAAQTRLATRDGVPWHTFVLKAYGEWYEDNAALMPETTRLLKGADNQISAAILSILEPGKHIVSHCGAMRSVYRYHLGLQVDEANDAYIQVEDLTYHWKEGEGVMFDDAFRHEVKSEAFHNTSFRVVLFMDIYRDDLPLGSKSLHQFGEWLTRQSPIISEAKVKAQAMTQKHDHICHC